MFLEDGDHVPCCLLIAGVEYISFLLSYHNGIGWPTHSEAYLCLPILSLLPLTNLVTSIIPHRSFPFNFNFSFSLSPSAQLSSIKKKKKFLPWLMPNSSYILGSPTAKFHEGVESFTISASTSPSLMPLSLHSRLVFTPSFQQNILPPG